MDKREYDQIEEAANRLQHEASVKCSRELEKAVDRVKQDSQRRWSCRTYR